MKKEVEGRAHHDRHLVHLQEQWQRVGLCGHCWEGPGAAFPLCGLLVHQGQWLAGLLFGPAQQFGLQCDGVVKSQIQWMSEKSSLPSRSSPGTMGRERTAY